MIRHLNCAVFALALLVPAGAAQADTASFTVHIKNIVTSGPTNYVFRVILDTEMTGCSDSFVFMNTDDQNYQAKAATLLTAFALKSTVILTVMYEQVDGVQRCVLGDTVIGQ